MRGKRIRGTWLLAAWLALAPAARAQDPAPPKWEVPLFNAQQAGQLVARGQNPGAAGYAPADIHTPAPLGGDVPLPLGSTRPEDGGFYTWAQALMWHQTSPLRDQLVAVRGFVVVDSSVPGVQPNTFIGDRTSALDTKQVSGPTSYVPGVEVGLGWKFKDASALSFSWFYLANTKYSAVATVANRDFNFRADFANTFLTAFVYNFPNDFSGPPMKAAQGGPFALFGIWNGAGIMTETWEQKFQQWDITYRIPVYDTECYRLSGIMGARFAWIWERYRWVTTDIDLAGNSDPSDVAIYSNIISNRMYGPFIGCVQEWYWGHGFAGMFDARCAALLDLVKERAQYQLAFHFEGADKLPATVNKRARTNWSPVTQFDTRIGLKWYPLEFVEVQMGYGVMGFLNTLTSQHPIDFNYSSLTPHYDHVFRLFDGFSAGIALVF
jgi:hypothetical protein